MAIYSRKQYVKNAFIFFVYLSFFIACENRSNKASLTSFSLEPTSLSQGSIGLSEEALLDPKTCQGCHQEHYAEWRASVHAYASEDPVFLALNRLGQEETQGALGDFCVRCHAPVAWSLQKTSDGLNLEALPQAYQGITCAYCHQISEVKGTHNNPLMWTPDGIMRGGLERPKLNSAHRSVYSPLLDGSRLESSDLCGSCHDIVTPSGFHLEKTFLEWKSSLFSSSNSSQGTSCGACHMPTRQDTNSSKTHHDHLMPGVDLVDQHEYGLALYNLNQRDLQSAVEEELNLSLLSELCGEVGINGGGDFEVYLENVAAGHRFPSGAALDRRLWVQITALDIEGQVLFESGAVAPNQASSFVAAQDESMWLLRDQAFDQEQQETHFFWNIESATRQTLPVSTLLPYDDSNYEEPHVLRRYRFGTEQVIYEVQMRVFMRPIGLEVLNHLVERNLLSADFVAMQPTFELTTASKVWRADQTELRSTLSGRELLCVSY